jgi:CNT family concentrative nucleoside transporter
MLERLISVLGIAAIILVAYAWSDNRKKISWRLVGIGLVLEVALGLLILKIPGTSDVFRLVGAGVNKIMDFAMEGAVFVFGDTITYGKFFKPGQEVLQTEFVFAVRIGISIIYVSGLCALGYYFGILQRLVSGMGFLLRKTLGLSGSESLSSAAAAWVGQVECQLLIKPYVPKLTRSELFTSMTAAMATASGSALVMYMSMGINATYLIAASFMSALGGIVLSKIIIPETQPELVQQNVKLTVEDVGANAFDAAAKGVKHGTDIAVSVVTMVAFAIGFMALCNFGLEKFLALFHMHASIQEVLGIPFVPVAWLMGVPWHDCLLAGRLMATELLFNEVVSYHDLAQLIHAGGPQVLAERTQMILTCALCGFAHLGSIGINIGGLGAMAPERRSEIAKIAFKSMIVANMATWLTAAICGLIF